MSFETPDDDWKALCDAVGWRYQCSSATYSNYSRDDPIEATVWLPDGSPRQAFASKEVRDLIREMAAYIARLHGRERGPMGLIDIISGPTICAGRLQR